MDHCLTVVIDHDANLDRRAVLDVHSPILPMRTDASTHADAGGGTTRGTATTSGLCSPAGSRRRQGSGARSPHSTGGCIGQGDTGGWAGAAQRIGGRVESSDSRSTRLSRSAAMTSPDGGGNPVTPEVAPDRAPESRAHRPLIPLWSLPRLFRGPPHRGDSAVNPDHRHRHGRTGRLRRGAA